ncbi:MAG: alpha/beta hydrolase [Acidimicrobiales bacterium]
MRQSGSARPIGGIQMQFDHSNIDAELVKGLDLAPAGLDDLTRETVARVREVRASHFPPAVETDVSIETFTVETAEVETRVLVYAHPDRDEGAGILWVHGGGYIIGTAEDDRARHLAEQLSCTVVSVDYRLAPEDPFPAGIEDCYASLLWVAANAGELRIDPSRIAIAGQSGGGGLAAGLALLNRDRGGPDLLLQLLLYPMIDNLHDTTSGRYTNHPIWDRQTSLAAWEMYLDGTPGLEASPYAAATRATDLAGLPPTYICVGTEDLFRDECIEYAARLMEADVPTELAVFPGLYHGGDLFVPGAQVSRRLEESYLRALRHALDE